MICEMPGITEKELRDRSHLFNLPYAADILTSHAVITATAGPKGVSLRSPWKDADEALMVARDRGIDLDAFLMS